MQSFTSLVDGIGVFPIMASFNYALLFLLSDELNFIEFNIELTVVSLSLSDKLCPL